VTVDLCDRGRDAESCVGGREGRDEGEAGRRMLKGCLEDVEGQGGHGRVLRLCGGEG